MTVTYAALSKTHNEEYAPDYWSKIRALYSSAALKRALGDKKKRGQLLYRRSGEEDEVYNGRVAQAFYIPYMGQLMDYIVASLAADPVRISPDSEENEKEPGSRGAKVKLSGKANGDPFYDAFFKDCSPPGGERMSINQLLRAQILTALLCKRAWTLCEMPRMDGELEPGERPANRLEEEELVADKAYACPVDPEDVLDWETDDSGELVWALTRCVTRRRASIEARRNMVREEYTYYTSKDWTIYVYEYDPEKNAPKDTQEPDSTISGPHSFQRVPLVPLTVPDGLWAGSKIESIATEIFNKWNALGFGVNRSLFQFILATLGAPDALNTVTEDPNRALTQVIGPGRMVVMGEKDKMGYVGPDAEPFRVALELINTLRDEMHRVLNQMALSVDNSGAALKRSADSKQVDAASSGVVLKDLGRRGREHVEDIYEMVSLGRQEKGKQWTGQGMDQFDEVSMDSLVTEAATLEMLSIPSPTFQSLYKFELARRALPGATEDQLEDIMDELSEGISAESELAKQQQDVQAALADNASQNGGIPVDKNKPAPFGKGKPKAGAKGADKKDKAAK